MQGHPLIHNAQQGARMWGISIFDMVTEGNILYGTQLRSHFGVWVTLPFGKLTHALHVRHTIDFVKHYV